MGLPELIEIVPLQTPVRAQMTVPGSKSVTNRALVLGALGQGETVLRGALWSEDTEVMIESLQELGFTVNIASDPTEKSNRSITVYGQGGMIPCGGNANEPLELDVGNAGTAARFLSALVCLGQGSYRLLGTPRMHERPQAGLFQALRELGYRIESPNDRLPAVIHGSGSREASCSVSIEESSQFAAALLLCACPGKWEVKIVGSNAEESPYVRMTSKLLEVFPARGGTFHIEPDCSSGSYFWAAGVVGSMRSAHKKGKGFAWPVEVRHWPESQWQIDARFPNCLEALLSSPGETTFSRATDLGDSIMTLITLAPLTAHPSRFTDLGRLRLQECERVRALRTELTKCGANVVEENDTLTISPSPLHGAEIETYHDHRLAMCFAILGLHVPGIRIKNPECVKKTFPNFFQKLAAAPPNGIGAALVDAATGRRLPLEELFAE